MAFDHRRHHDDAVRDDALIVLQRLRHLGGAEAAIAFAQNIFGRADAAVLGDIERDHLGERFRVAMNVPERLPPSCLAGRLQPVPTGSISTRSVKASQVSGLSVSRTWAPSKPLPNAARRGPTRPRLRNAEPAPGPPLNTNVIGRAGSALSLGFRRLGDKRRIEDGG